MKIQAQKGFEKRQKCMDIVSQALKGLKMKNQSLGGSEMVAFSCLTFN